jgi:hypothetical protein
LVCSIGRPRCEGEPLCTRGGRRHLLQLVAIKRLQAAGASLTDVQSRLAGLGDRQLGSIARLPTTPSVDRDELKPANRGDFWRAVPAMAGPVSPPAPASHRSGAAAAPTPAPISVTQIELAPGVVLSFPTQRPADHDDARAAAETAEPLLRELRVRGLIRSS